MYNSVLCRKYWFFPVHRENVQVYDSHTLVWILTHYVLYISLVLNISFRRNIEVPWGKVVKNE